MPTSIIALQILLILLPGFGAAYTVQLLVARRTQSDYERTVEALLYSFLIYVAYSIVRQGTLPFHIVQDPQGKSDTIRWDPSGLVWLAVITFLFSLAMTAYYRHDGNTIFRLVDTKNPRIVRWLGWLKLTERTTRNSIWNDILENEYTEGSFVQIELSDGRSLLGVVFYYSDNADDCSVFLSRASWIDSSGHATKIEGPGILLTKGSGIKTISLLSSDKLETVADYE